MVSDTSEMVSASWPYLLFWTTPKKSKSFTTSLLFVWLVLKLGGHIIFQVFFLMLQAYIHNLGWSMSLLVLDAAGSKPYRYQVIFFCIRLKLILVPESIGNTQVRTLYWPQWEKGNGFSDVLLDPFFKYWLECINGRKQH